LAELLGSSTLPATIDYEHPAVRTVVSKRQIGQYTSTQGTTGIALRAMVINSQGHLVITDRGNPGAMAFGEAMLLEIDISGSLPVLSTIAREEDMAAVLVTSMGTDPQGDPLDPPHMNFVGMAHAFLGGTDFYYLAQDAQNPANCTTCSDEIIEVTVDAEGATSIRRVGSIDGINALSYHDGHLYIPVAATFGSGSDTDGIYRMNIATGATALVAGIAEYEPVTGALPGTREAGMTMDLDGLVYAFSEEYRGGSDDILTIDTLASNSMTILEPKETFDPEFPGIISMAVDTNGTLYAFDQSPTSVPRRLIIREANGALHFPPTDYIVSALHVYSANQITFPNDGLRAVVADEGKVVLYGVLADLSEKVGNPRLVSFTFRDPDLIPPGMLGDINGDGILNVADVTELGRSLTEETPPDPAIGDVNQDGTVDELDMEALALLIVG
jgi:hypothetical protein